MDCKALTNDVLLDLAEGADLPAARAHLEGCARCRAELETVRALATDLAALGRRERPVKDPALVGKIVARLDRRDRKFVVARRSPLWAWASAAAAAAILVAVLMASLRERPQPPTEPEETALTPAPVPKPERPMPLPEPPKPAPERPAPNSSRAGSREPVPVPTPEPKVEVPKPPPVPQPPAPEPPPPAPEPEKPRETRPAQVTLAVTRVEGTFESLQGTSWKKLDPKPFAWTEPVRSGDRLARLTLGDGTQLILRPRTELRVGGDKPPTLLLERGEVFCDVPPARTADVRFAVVTAEARVLVTGTQFIVRRADHTEVAVASGEVKLANEKGEVAVPAGFATSARKGTPPPRPRPLDERFFAWRRELDPPETARFRFDFEDGRQPALWVGGRVVAGPARGLNRFAFEGGVNDEKNGNVQADLSRVDRRIPVIKPNLRLRFRYHAPSGEGLTAQFVCERARDNFRFDVKSIPLGKWEVFDAPLSEFFRLADGSKLEEGDRLTWFSIVVWNAQDPVAIDDVELVEVHKP